MIPNSHVVCVDGVRHEGDVLLHLDRPHDDALGQVSEVEARRDLELFLGEQRLDDRRVTLGRSVLQFPVVPAKHESHAENSITLSMRLFPFWSTRSQAFFAVPRDSDKIESRKHEWQFLEALQLHKTIRALQKLDAHF